MRNWTKIFFDDEHYEAFYEGVLTQKRTDIEVDFLNKIFSAQNIKEVLDIPCGYGRHAIGLAKLGYKIIGVDAYQIQLDLAVKNAQGLPIKWLCKDMRKWSAEGSVDAAINMFTSFGYFSKEDDLKVVHNLVKSVRKEGIIILDVRNPVRLINEMIENNLKIVRENNQGIEIETYNLHTRRHSVEYVRAGISKKGIMNIYSLDELQGMFSVAGANAIAVYGNYKGELYDASTSPRLILLAQKR